MLIRVIFAIGENPYAGVLHVKNREMCDHCVWILPMAKSPPVLLHEHNEYIDIDVFKKGIDVYETLIGKLGSVEYLKGKGGR